MKKLYSIIAQTGHPGAEVSLLVGIFSFLAPANNHETSCNSLVVELSYWILNRRVPVGVRGSPAAKM